MGKSGGRRMKSGGSNQASVENSAPTGNSSNGGVELDSSIFLKRAHELKEEGNRRFQNKDYAGALEQYENALRLTPKTYPERAVFHSNRATCLMQMKPIDYETVIAEFTMALQVQPRFVRALLRRAHAFEAIGKYELAVQDGQSSIHGQHLEVPIRWRPLKLVYDHDIRHARMPVNCSFRVLRDIVSKRFLSSNSVLVKYKDNDGDLVTITCTDELRFAESSLIAIS